MHPAIKTKLRDLVKSWKDQGERLEEEGEVGDRAQGQGVIYAEAARQLQAVLTNELAGAFYKTGESYECSVCRTESNGPCSNVKCPIGYHNVWAREGSEDATGDGPDPLEDGRAKSGAISNMAVWESIGPHLRALSGRAFEEQKDERALWLRGLAKEMDEIGRQKRAAYHERYPKKES